jgi:NedA-like, galactose-binding domain
MQVQQAFNTAINENAIVVISGRPGVGKSRCLFEYAVRKMMTAPVSVLCSPSGETYGGASSKGSRKDYGYRSGRSPVVAQGGSSGNLALGKPATQSSTAFDAPASRGVDGNTSGNWANNSVTSTANEHQPWWQVDLGGIQQIEVVKLWNRTDCCSDRLGNFHVLVSNNPFSSTDLAATINQAGVSNYYTSGAVGLAKEIGVYRSGRYVRVQLAGDNFLSLA